MEDEDLLLYSFVNEHLDEFKKIRKYNGFGYCEETMFDIINLLKSNFSTQRFELYGGKDNGFIEDDYIYTHNMPEINIIEDGKTIFGEYVIHWLPLINNEFVIDIAYPSEIISAEDIIFFKNSYIREIINLNKECQINSYNAR